MCVVGGIGVVRALLAMPSIDVNAIERRFGRTPLLLFLESGRSWGEVGIEVLRILLAVPNIDVNHFDNDGESALHLSVKCASGHATKALLEMKTGGINVNMGDNWNQAVLHKAVYFGNINAVGMLLADPSINVNVVNDDAQMPLYVAVTLLGCGDLLAVADVDVNIAADDGNAPLHVVCRDCCGLEMAKLLLASRNIDVNSRSVLGDTPLCLAVKCCSIGLVRALLAMPHVDVNLANDEGLAPLHFACIKNDLEFVKVCSPMTASMSIHRRYWDSHHCLWLYAVVTSRL